MQEHSHDPIVPKKVFFQAQGEMMRRKADKDPSMIRYADKIPLTRRLICGKCGQPLRRFLKKNGMTEWRCWDRRRSRCSGRVVKETDVMTAVKEALQTLSFEDLLRKQAALWNGDLKRLDALIEYNENNTEERTRLILERAEAANREMRIRLLLELVDGKGRMETTDPACRDYEEFFDRTRVECKDVQEKIIRFVEKVTVLEEGGFEVEFKGGVKVRIDEETDGGKEKRKEAV